MERQDYHNSFMINVSPKVAYENILKVSQWWTSTFKGSAAKAGDTFDVTFGKTTVAFKVVEAVPQKKLVWLVTDSHLDWQNNKTEWTGTKVVWDISEDEKGTRVDMTHVGLVPEAECYKNCEEGWNGYVGESLPKLIASGAGVVYEGS